MHSFVFGFGFCHVWSFWKIWVTPTYGLKHATACCSTANFSWGPLVRGHFPFLVRSSSEKALWSVCISFHPFVVKLVVLLYCRLCRFDTDCSLLPVAFCFTQHTHTHTHTCAPVLLHIIPSNRLALKHTKAEKSSRTPCFLRVVCSFRLGSSHSHSHDMVSSQSHALSLEARLCPCSPHLCFTTSTTPSPLLVLSFLGVAELLLLLQ